MLDAQALAFWRAAGVGGGRGAMFNFDRLGGRALTTIVGLILLLVGISRLFASGGGSGLVVAVPIAVVTIGFGGWLIGSALSGVRIEPGIAVGGGPMLVRVPLEPGEAVLVHGVGGYERADAVTGKARSFSGRLTGECFVTESRVIVTPQRLMSFIGWRGFDFQTADVAAAAPIDRMRMMGVMRRAIEIRLHNGTRYVIWPRSEELRVALLGLGGGTRGVSS